MENKKLLKEIQAKGINFLPVAKKQINNKETYICPLCNNGIGKSGDGICYDPKHSTAEKKIYKCFKCGVSGDTFDWWLYLNLIFLNIS